MCNQDQSRPRLFPEVHIEEETGDGEKCEADVEAEFDKLRLLVFVPLAHQDYIQNGKGGNYNKV